jgi:hypothetical protein
MKGHAGGLVPRIQEFMDDGGAGLNAESPQAGDALFTPRAARLNPARFARMTAC